MAPDSELSAGRLLRERFTVEGKLAEGGMSVLYTVSDKNLPGLWVLKQMRPLVGNPGDLIRIRKQFQEEAALLAGLSHPGIPRVIDCFSEDGCDYLVEELVQGRTIEELLHEKGRLPEKEVVDMGLQILDILQYLHEKGIVYRDLKPGNLMLDLKDRIRLVDFGIARHFTPGRSSDTVIVGTPGYASPEHYGKSQTDARSDIYSLGATLHALLTGSDPAEKPFQFTPPAVLIPGTSSGLSQVVMKALALRPEDRYPSAGAMSGTLRTCLASAPAKQTYSYSRSFMERLLTYPIFSGETISPDLPRRIEIALHEEGFDWTVEDTRFSRTPELRSGKIRWDEVEEVRVCRGIDTRSRQNFLEKMKVTTFEIRITAKRKVIHIPPAMKDWRDLVNWILYRAGLTQSRTVREEGADLVYDRSR